MDWLHALAETVLEFDGKGAKFGKWDCCQFISAYNKRVNGNDPAKQFRYSSERGAMKIIAQHGGMEEMLTEHFGAAIDGRYAKPGDIVLTTVTDKNKTWGVPGVYNGYCVFLVHPNKGVGRADANNVLNCWRVCYG